MIPVGLLMMVGKAAVSAVAPTIIEAASNKFASMKSAKQQKQLAKLYNISAAANEMIASVEHLANPNTNKELREAMERRKLISAKEAGRTAASKERVRRVKAKAKPKAKS